VSSLRGLVAKAQVTTLRDSRRTTLRRPRPGASDAPAGGESTAS